MPTLLIINLYRNIILWLALDTTLSGKIDTQSYGITSVIQYPQWTFIRVFNIHVCSKDSAHWLLLPSKWLNSCICWIQIWDLSHLQEEQRFTLRHKSDVPEYAKDIYSMKAINMHFHFLTSDNSYAKGPVRSFK